MIHTPRAVQHILPSMYPDQLAHAVIQCRTVKPMRKTTYSTQFQLCEQRGSFAGIDTFSMTDFQNMEITSSLLTHYESLSLVYRKDINSLLTKLAEDKKIGKCVANSRREEAKYVVNKMGIDVDELNFGATYVPMMPLCVISKDSL